MMLFIIISFIFFYYVYSFKDLAFYENLPASLCLFALRNIYPEVSSQPVGRGVCFNDSPSW